MKKVTILVVAAMAFIGLSTSGAYAQGAGPANRAVIQLAEQNGSGQTGTATLTGTADGKLMVVVELSNGTSVAQPAHIHNGTCANLDPKPAYPLTSLTNGVSDTTVDVSMEMLMGGQYAVNVHKSAAEASVYVACGDIVNMQLGGGAGTGETGGETSGGEISEGNETVGMPSTGNSDQTFIVLGLIALAATFTGTGLRFARRKA